MVNISALGTENAEEIDQDVMEQALDELKSYIEDNNIALRKSPALDILVLMTPADISSTLEKAGLIYTNNRESTPGSGFQYEISGSSSLAHLALNGFDFNGSSKYSSPYIKSQTP